MRRKSLLFLLCIPAVALILGSTLLDDEEEIPIDKLPEAVVKAVKDKYPDAKLVEAEKETKNGKTVYEVTVKKGEKTIEVKVSAEGKIIDDDDDDDKDEKKG